MTRHHPLEYLHNWITMFCFRCSSSGLGQFFQVEGSADRKKILFGFSNDRLPSCLSTHLNVCSTCDWKRKEKGRWKEEGDKEAEEDEEEVIKFKMNTLLNKRIIYVVCLCGYNNYAYAFYRLVKDIADIKSLQTAFLAKKSLLILSRKSLQPFLKETTFFYT